MKSKAVEPERKHKAAKKDVKTGRFVTRKVASGRLVTPESTDIIGKKAVVTSRDARSGKFSRNTLSRMAKKGLLVKIKPGVYESINRPSSEHESLIDVCAQAPKAVITLLSALQFHGLTTENPRQVWVAFQRGQRVSKVDYPPIRHFIFSEKAFEYGIEEYDIQGVTIKVYSVAKTVADCFKFRNKVGFDVAKEALKEAIQSKSASRDDIWHAAKICRVQNVIRPYMESLE